MQDPPTVYLVDDQALIRASSKSWLDRSNQFRVIGQQGGAWGAIEEVRVLKPDVVLLDIMMPGLSGLDALPLIIEANPTGLVVMVTDSENAAFAKQALERGARGYLSKADDPTELLRALARIVAGEQYVSPRIPGFQMP